MGNITIAFSPCLLPSPFKGAGGSAKLWLRTTINAQTCTYYQKADVILSSAMKQVVGCVEEVKPQCVLGLGLGYEWKHLDIDITAQNITNNDYKVGSLLSDGVPRKGRQILGKLTFKF